MGIADEPDVATTRSSSSDWSRTFWYSNRRAGPGSSPSSSASVEPGPLVGPQGIGLTSAAVQGHHLQRPQPLAKRVVDRQGLQLTQHGIVAADAEIGVDALLDGAETELGQPEHLGTDRLLVGYVGVRRTSPQLQGGGQHVAGLGRRRFEERRTANQLGCEPNRIDRQQIRIDPVAGASRLQRKPRTQAPSDVRDVNLHRLARRGRRILAPQSVDQPFGRDHRAGGRHQQRQQQSRLAPPRVDVTVGPLDRDRTENADLVSDLFTDGHTTSPRR